MKRISLLVPALLLAAGCVPPPREEDEIAKTFRMIEEAKRTRSTEWPPRNVLVSIERIELFEGSELDARALAGYADGNVRVVAGSRRGGLARAGVELGYANDGFWAALAAARESGRRARRTRAEVVVMPGRAAYLTVASNRPVPVLEILTPEGRTTVWRNASVGTHLTAIPRVAGERLFEIELYPAFSRAGAGGLVAQTHLATRVRVPEGRGLVLAENTRAGTHVSRALFGGSAGREKSRTVLVVTARGM